MPVAILIFIGFQLLGEMLRHVLHLPLPGPVIGLFLLTAWLVFERRNRAAAALPPTLDRTANALIAHMGLLFIPAGVGVMTQADLLRHQCLPILAGVVGSTLLSLAVTGLVLQHMNRELPQSAGLRNLRGHRSC